MVAAVRQRCARRLSSSVFCLVALGLPATAVAAPPVFTGLLGNPQAIEGEPLILRVTAQDPEGDEIRFQLDAPPDGMTLGATDGILRWNPTQAQANVPQHVLRIRISAGGDSQVTAVNLPAFRLVRSKHFRVFWQVSEFPGSPDYGLGYAEDLRDALERSWAHETGGKSGGGLEYRPPRLVTPGRPLRVRVRGGLKDNAQGVTTCYWGDHPCFIEISTRLSLGELQAVAAHELYHAVQDAYRPRRVWWREGWKWWKEATATWAEDQVFGAVNDYLRFFLEPNSVFRQPGTNLVDTHKYAGALFPIFLGEYLGSPEPIRRSFEYYAATAAQPKLLLMHALRDVIAPRDFNVAWAEFALRNYLIDNAPGHQYREGAQFIGAFQAAGTGPPPAVQDDRRKDPMLNLHYVMRWGAPQFQRPPLDIAINSTLFNAVEGQIPGLAAYYLSIAVPQALADAERPSRCFLYFDGDDGSPWSAQVVAIPRGRAAYGVEIHQLLAADAGKPSMAGMLDLECGGSGGKAVVDLVVVVANADIDPYTYRDPKRFRLSGAFTPVFQSHDYAAGWPADQSSEPRSGSTRTVRNLSPADDAEDTGPDEDNVYRNGETIALEVDLSDSAQETGAFVIPTGTPIPPDRRTLSADFSAIDSAYSEEDVTVTATDAAAHRYRIEYRIKEGNTLFERQRAPEPLPVRLAVTSLSRVDPDRDRNEDLSFQIVLDNEPPQVRRVRLVQELGGKETVVLDSQDGSSNPAEVPGKGKARFKLQVEFAEPMQTHSASGQQLDPQIRFNTGKGETWLQFARGRGQPGWSKTSADNDTWAGEVVFEAADFTSRSPPWKTPLVIGGKDDAGQPTTPDAAGNPLDVTLDSVAVDPEQRYVIEWKQPGVERVQVLQGPVTVYDSEGGRYREATAGELVFHVRFNMPMKEATLAFGPDPPFDRARVALAPVDGEDREFEGRFSFAEPEFAAWQGVHRIRIEGTGANEWVLDTDLVQPKVQPDTSHWFLIGAPRAWRANLSFVGEYSVPGEGFLATTEIRIKATLEQDTPQPWQGWPERHRQTIENLQGFKASYPEPTPEMFGNERSYRAAKDQYELQTAQWRRELAYAENALRILQGVRRYVSTSLELHCRAQYTRRESDGSWAEGLLEGCDVAVSAPPPYQTYAPQVLPANSLELVLTTITEDDWEAYVRAREEWYGGTGTSSVLMVPGHSPGPGWTQRFIDSERLGYGLLHGLPEEFVARYHGALWLGSAIGDLIVPRQPAGSRWSIAGENREGVPFSRSVEVRQDGLGIPFVPQFGLGGFDFRPDQITVTPDYLFGMGVGWVGYALEPAGDLLFRNSFMEKGLDTGGQSPVGQREGVMNVQIGVEPIVAGGD